MLIRNAMKKFIVFLFITTLVVLLVIVWSTRKNTGIQTPQNDLIPPRTAPLLSAPRNIVFPGEENVVFSYGVALPELPGELPSYSTAYPQNIDVSVAELAKIWGFTSPLKKPVPYVFDWVEKDKNLSVNTRTNTLTFAYFYPATSSSMVRRLTQESVLKNIADVGLLPKSLLLTETSREVDTTQGEGLDAGGFPSTFIFYQYKLANQPYPFIFTGVNQYAATIRVLADGSVVSFSLRIPPLVKPLESKKTLTHDEILLSLNENKGILTRAGEKFGSDPYKQVDSFSSVEISSITIGFFFDAEIKKFDPIYVISGTAFGDRAYSVTYYLRATM